jgi:hypothetical protein
MFYLKIENEDWENVNEYSTKFMRQWIHQTNENWKNASGYTNKIIRDWIYQTNEFSKFFMNLEIPLASEKK